MIHFVDLFAGIGGMRLGLEAACQELGLNYNCVLSSEIDSKACTTYYLNFGETPQGDIRKIENVSQFADSKMKCNTGGFTNKGSSAILRSFMNNYLIEDRTNEPSPSYPI
ncbi:DNA cytosine methyltransferase [Geitlerinema sp. CS-897]|nr:DNA cytosine methyltransferase [Geitlerinema sp. CS-897]